MTFFNEVNAPELSHHDKNRIAKAATVQQTRFGQK